MKNHLAYIDEFGNNGLDFDKDGVSTHFIVTAILINGNMQDEVEKQIEIIRQKNFQTGEMKSSGLGNNDTRRLKVLKELNDINYHIFSVVIDKRELKGEGFNYKGSFYKFLHSLVDRELFKVFPDLLIVADEHGGQEFKEGFISYINRRHIPNLFEQAEFKLSNSKSSLIVQLADLITGTLARCYETKKLSKNRSKFLQTLKEKIIEIKFWPPDYKPYAYNPGRDFENFNPTISDLGINLACQFLDDTKESTDPATTDQRSFLRYLVFHFININPETYVSTYELINHIDQFRNSSITMHYFRSKVVAKLRDKGILISSSNKGYKLPSSSKDLYEFVNHSNSYIQPMIERLFKCRNRIKLATKNELDIFDHEEFKYLNVIKENLP